jgi:NADH-quinone oxidoreductase subunit D
MAKAVGAETIIHYVLRDRERILDLFELLTGARYSLNFLRFGGVCADVTDGSIERVLEVCELIRIRMKEYNDLFTFNHSFIKRTAHVGIIPSGLIRACGITGPNARASGIQVDVRKDAPYQGYDQIDFEVPLGRGEGGSLGDVHDRFLLRLREITQSMEILKQLAEVVPSGDFTNGKLEKDYIVPSGEAYSRIESSRGLLGCHVVSDGKKNPSRVQFRPPTLANLLVIPKLVSGIRIEDLPVVLASLDLGIAEADR